MEYPPEVPYVAMRASAALFGAGLIPVLLNYNFRSLTPQ